MSIEGIANYEHFRADHVRPDWERLERIEYCDQDTVSEEHSFRKRLVRFFRNLF